MSKTFRKDPVRASLAPEPLDGQAASARKGQLGHLDYEAQVEALAPDPAEMRVDEAPAPSDDVPAIAADGVRGGGRALPHLGPIQESFGAHDVSGVTAHTDGASARANREMGSLAYASGSHIAFGPSPDLFTAAHEAAHVVQQRAGVQLRGGVGSVGDPYEQHADAVAREVVAGRSAEALLSQGAGSPVAVGAGSAAATVAVQHRTETTTGALSAGRVRRSLAWCRGRQISDAVWAQIASVVGSSSTELDETLVQAIAAFQASKGLTVDGCPGDVTMQWMSQAPGGEGLDSQVRNDQVVYLGLNPGSRGPEYNTIKGVVGAGSVTGALGMRNQDHARVGGRLVDLNTEEGLDAFVASLVGLDPTTSRAARVFLEAFGSEGRDEMAQMLRIFYQAEMGQRVIKRVVLSGHSGGWSIWGDDNGSVKFETLADLGSVFPNAVGQVEDLMLSACNTAQKSKLDQYMTIFPNLKSVWGYVGYSPSAATGSIKHIKKWSDVTSGPMDPDKMEQGRQDIAAGRGKRDQNVALWTRDGTDERYGTASTSATFDYPTLRSLVDTDLSHYTAAYRDGVISLPDLSRLYTNMQSLVGTHRGSLGDEGDAYEQMMKHVLYLRHWGNISRNFMDEHGAVIASAFGDAGVAMPNIASMSRAAFLAMMQASALDPQGEAHELLTGILKDLDPNRIADNWI